MAFSEEQIDKIKLTLATGGWREVIKPTLAKRGNEALKQLILSPSERTGEYKDLGDSELRARIREIEWVLSVWDNEVNVFEYNRRLEERERQQNGLADPVQ